MNCHYYFKFLKENKGLEMWLRFKNKDKIDEGDEVELSIYYDVPRDLKKNEDGFAWTVNDLTQAIEYFRKKKQSKKINQIQLFFELEKEKNTNRSFFWIFNDEMIYVFEGHDLKVFDGADRMTDDNGSKPKSISVICFDKFKKKELPEFFSNINSNQKYNRGTIAKLESSENEFAKFLIDGSRIPVHKNNFHKYLSPVEFETLIFLIFNQNGNYCSAFRGGTLKDYDLRITIENPIDGIEKGHHWVQVKKKEKVTPTKDFNSYVVCTGEKSNTDKKILGIDWVRNNVGNNESIINWLTYATFGEAYKEYIDFRW